MARQNGNSKSRGGRNYSNRRNANRSKAESPTEQTRAQSSSPSAIGSSAAINNIVNAASSVAVRNIAGNEVHPATKSGVGWSIAGAKFIIPGVYSIEYAPIFGFAAGNQTDPVNLAARNMWMNLRSLYSNKIPYTAGAIVMYSMALDSILSAYQWLKRALGVCFAYDARNKYVSNGILTAMYIDPDDFRDNIPNVRVYINKLATQLSAFGVPLSLRFITDHIDATAHVYVDDTTANAQYLIMTPEFLWKMNWTNNKLTPVAWHGYNSTTFLKKTMLWADISTKITDLVENFLNYEDAYMIASDFQRLYTDLAKVTPVDETFAIGPEYSLDFLKKLHNATYPSRTFLQVEGDNGEGGASFTSSAWEVSELNAPQNVGAITTAYSSGFRVQNADTYYAWLSCTAGGLYDFNTSDPTTGDILDATNMKYFVAKTQASATGYQTVFIPSSGTLILTDIHAITYAKNGLQYYLTSRNISLHQVDPTTTSAIIPGPTADYSVIALWNQHPLVPQGTVVRAIANNKVSNMTYTYLPPFGELDQYVTLDADEIARIHEAIILDRFDAGMTGILGHRA